MKTIKRVAMVILALVAIVTAHSVLAMASAVWGN